MGIEKGEKFAKGDVYIGYPFEEVKFRWDFKQEKTYLKFYGEQEDPVPVPHDNRLCNDALMWGDEIDRAEYDGS